MKPRQGYTPNIINNNSSLHPAHCISNFFFFEIDLEVPIRHMPDLADLPKPLTPIPNSFHLQWPNTTDNKYLPTLSGKNFEEA